MKTTIRILHVIPSINPLLGGVAEVVRSLEKGLRLNATENHVVCFDDNHEIVQWENGTLKIHTLGQARGVWNYNEYFNEWLRTNYPFYEVIIIHGLWLFHSYATMKILRNIKSNTPKVYIMPHGMLDPWFQKAPSRRLKAIRNEIYWRLIERQVVNEADGLLFTCEEELRLARTTFKGYRPKQEINVGYGIAPPPVHTAAMDEAFRQKLDRPVSTYWLYLSRIHEKKGLDLLLSAYRQLWEEQTNIPDLVIAGPGIESAFGQRIAKMIATDAILQKHLHLVGMLTGDAKWGALYNCEAFVLPSHQENFGIAVVEALACGKPVLISNQVNIWREIIAAKAGLVSNDTQDAILAMLKLFNNMEPTSKQEMAEQTINAFHNYFHIEKTAQAFLQAIR